MAPDPGRPRERSGRALRIVRTILIALVVAFTVGFLIGTILRGRLEEPVRYYGAAGPEPVSTRPDSCADPVTFARGPA